MKVQLFPKTLCYKIKKISIIMNSFKIDELVESPNYDDLGKLIMTDNMWRFDSFSWITNLKRKNMKILNIGDTGKAVYEACELVVITTYKEKDMPLSDTKKIVPNVLVWCCDNCRNVVAIPTQETHKIKAVKESR